MECIFDTSTGGGEIKDLHTEMRRQCKALSLTTCFQLRYVCLTDYDINEIETEQWVVLLPNIDRHRIYMLGIQAIHSGRTILVFLFMFQLLEIYIWKSD